MTGRPISLHPKLELLIHQVKTLCECRLSHCWDFDVIFSFSVLRCRNYRTAPGLEIIASHLLVREFLCVDSDFLQSGVLHAKFDHEFDIWVDSRESSDYTGAIAADFTGEIVLQNGDIESLDVLELARRFQARYLRAIDIFDDIVHQAARVACDTRQGVTHRPRGSDCENRGHQKSNGENHKGECGYQSAWE